MSESIMKEITAVGPKPIALDPSIVNYWFWKFVPVDPLVFFAPSHDGSIVRIAREVYHRLLGRIVSESAHGMQLAVIAAAWLATVFLGEKFAFRGGDRFGILLGFAAFGAFLFFAVPVLMRLACPASASHEAQSIVKRAFLRDLPPDTPADLRDEVQNSWLTIDGRPLASEIAADDGRTLEATTRRIWSPRPRRGRFRRVPRDSILRRAGWAADQEWVAVHSDSRRTCSASRSTVARGWCCSASFSS